MKVVREIKSIKRPIYDGIRLGNGLVGLREYTDEVNKWTYKNTFYTDSKLIVDKDNKIDKNILNKFSVISYIKVATSNEELELVFGNDENYYAIERYIKRYDPYDDTLIVPLDSINNEPSNIPKEKIYELIEVLKERKIGIEVLYRKVENDIVLCREIKKAGINYVVYKYDTNYKHHIIEEVKLEDIIRDSNMYPNVQNDGSTIKIAGLDGMYEYDIQKVYDVYKRKEVSTTRSKKSKLVGVNLIEKINLKSELVELSTDQANIMVPSEAKKILSGAIKINENNTDIVFRNTLENIDKSPYSYRGEYYGTKSPIERLHIECNEDVTMKILKAFTKPSQFKDIDIVFYRDITPYEIYYIAFSNVFRQIKLENGLTIRPETVKDALEIMVNNELNLDILKEPVKFTLEEQGSRLVGISDRAYRNFKYKHKKLKEESVYLLKMADEDLRNSFIRFTKQIDSLIASRDKELKKNIKIAKENL